MKLPGFCVPNSPAVMIREGSLLESCNGDLACAAGHDCSWHSRAPAPLPASRPHAQPGAGPAAQRRGHVSSQPGPGQHVCLQGRRAGLAGTQEQRSQCRHGARRLPRQRAGQGAERGTPALGPQRRPVLPQRPRDLLPAGAGPRHGSRRRHAGRKSWRGGQARARARRDLEAFAFKLRHALRCAGPERPGPLPGLQPPHAGEGQQAALRRRVVGGQQVAAPQRSRQPGGARRGGPAPRQGCAQRGVHGTLHIRRDERSSGGGGCPGCRRCHERGAVQGGAQRGAGGSGVDVKGNQRSCELRGAQRAQRGVVRQGRACIRHPARHPCQRRYGAWFNDRRRIRRHRARAVGIRAGREGHQRLQAGDE
uniref:Uncharacterized protein n=1 Tax=Auxenochlorella protothecoides TaxID=3075 RepID=A0A1D2AF06_AUXPR